MFLCLFFWAGNSQKNRKTGRLLQGTDKLDCPAQIGNCSFVLSSRLVANHFAVNVQELLNEYVKNPLANHFHFEGHDKQFKWCCSHPSDHDHQHVQDSIATD